MAFRVEDGSGLPDANSYASVQYFRDYHADRGSDTSSYTDAEVEHSLVRATDYIDRRWGGSFVGMRTSGYQSLEWPRTSAFYNDGRFIDGVPVEVRQATCEYALRGMTDALAPDPTYDASNGVVLERDEQVGPIRERFRFGNGGGVLDFRKYPMADALLRSVTYQGSRVLRV